ncbi:tRNA(adenine(34)) deaminase [Bertholletia excelsa]
MPILLKLNQIAPLENLRHVKRVCKQHAEDGKTQLAVVLCMAHENGSQLENIPNDVLELISTYDLNTFMTKVCKFAAMSKEEWEEQCKLWPTSYHPPTYNIDGITGFSQEDSRSILYFMKLAIDMAKSGHCEVVNAAVIVDPSTKEVIARACDQVCSQNAPGNETNAKTCCFNQQEAFASKASVVAGECNTNLLSQSSCDESVDSLQSCATVSCLYPWKWMDQKSHTCFCHPLRHAALVAIECSAARDRHLFPGVGDAGSNSAQLDDERSSIGSPAKRQKTKFDNVENGVKVNCQASGFPSNSVRPYLCTGYDIFLVWEPCSMCAMALVHQRIRRIFYAFSNPNEGALGSVHRLQGEKSLNHHYAVFRVVLPEKLLRRG